MKLFKINLVNVPSDENLEIAEAVRAAVEEIYNRGANAGFYVGVSVTAAAVFGGWVAHEVNKAVEKRKANQKTE